MTLEAIALHQLDNLDAKLHNFHQLMRDDANSKAPGRNINKISAASCSKAAAKRASASATNHAEPKRIFLNETL